MNKTPAWTSHDIQLPQYGPYNKQYVGFSHIAAPDRGLRLDVDVLPGFYRRAVMDTRSITDSGARLWQARPDLMRFVYRYELQQPNKLYMETDFTQEGTEAAVRCTFVNETDLPQSVQADFCFSLRVPTFYSFPLVASQVQVPDGVHWVSAAAYDAQTGLTGITHDGFRLGERWDRGAVRGCLMVLPEQNVQLTYELQPIQADSLLLRYRSEADNVLIVNGMPVQLPASKMLTTVTLPLNAGEYTHLVMEHAGAELLLDGFAIGMNVGRTAFEPWPDAFVPQVEERAGELVLRYPTIDHAYTIRWDAKDYVVRELIGANDGDILTRSIHNHVSRTLRGDGQGYFTDLFVRPVFLQPHSRAEFTLRISAGETMGEMPKQLPLPVYEENPCGKVMASSMERLRAAVAMNVVYPAFYRGGFIRSYTPGRIWDSYYTWDCGMIALGLLTIDHDRAMDSLRAYLMPQEDEHSPYLNHGSPVLTQMFGFKELLDAGEKEACAQLYPALRYAYRFFLKLPRHGGLIAAWHIFYNSGGWDDYPTQKYMHEHHLTETSASVILTAAMLIYGSILRNAASQLGFEEDIAAYEADRAELTAAIAPCWDEETGYFGYSTCDAEGNFAGILRDEQGINPNQGLDGLYPLLAGMGSAEQKRRMLHNLRDGLITPIGVSVVDTRSPYFINSGYWNGSVWMPHQWIVWKAMLDLGQADLANRIARKMLHLWQKETDVSGNCYEHFMLTTGRGAGFHHFSGLSSPVLTLYKAYYMPGSATVGFDTAILQQNWNADKTTVELTVETHRSGAVLLLTLKEGCEYTFTGLPQGTKVRKLHPGTYSLQWKQTGKVMLTVKPQDGE